MVTAAGKMAALRMTGGRLPVGPLPPAAGAPPPAEEGACGVGSLEQPHTCSNARRDAASAAPLPMRVSARRLVLIPLYKSRQDSIRLQTESAGLPQTEPNTPVLAWMNPVTLPAHPDPEPLEPDAPDPSEPIWTAI